MENFNIWNNCRILIHEATFLNRDDISDNDERRNKHSVLEDVLKAASEINLQQLILGHISSRYKPEEIDKCIKKCILDFNIKFSVTRILPGEFVYDILSARK